MQQGNALSLEMMGNEVQQHHITPIFFLAMQQSKLCLAKEEIFN